MSQRLITRTRDHSCYATCWGTQKKIKLSITCTRDQSPQVGTILRSSTIVPKFTEEEVIFCSGFGLHITSKTRLAYNITSKTRLAL